MSGEEAESYREHLHEIRDSGDHARKMDTFVEMILTLSSRIGSDLGLDDWQGAIGVVVVGLADDETAGFVSGYAETVALRDAGKADDPVTEPGIMLLAAQTAMKGRLGLNMQILDRDELRKAHEEKLAADRAFQEREAGSGRPDGRAAASMRRQRRRGRPGR